MTRTFLAAVKRLVLLPCVFCSSCQQHLPPASVTSIEGPVRTAIEAASMRVKSEPASAEAHGHLGMVCQVHGLLAEAQAAYTRAGELDSRDVRWARLLGITCQTLSLPLEAEKAFVRAVAIEPRDLVSLSSLAILRSERGEDDAARKLHLDVLQIDPGYIAARVGLGQLALRAGELEAARKNLELAIEADPRCGAAHATLATVLAREGKAAEAEFHRRWSQVTPGKIPLPDPLMDQVSALGVGYTSHLRRGKDAGSAGEWTKAVEEFRQAIKQRGDVAEARYYLGSSLLRVGSIAEGLSELEAVTRMESKRIDAWLQIARAHLSQGRPEEALAAIAKALELDATHAEALTLRARVYLARGNKDLASADLERAVTVHPDDATVRLAMAEVLLKPRAERASAQTDENVRERELARARLALSEFEKTLLLQIDAADAHDGAGMAHMQLWDLTPDLVAKEKHLQTALELFAQEVKWFPQRKEGHLHLVQALRSAKKDREALEAVRRARSLWPDEARFRQ